MKLFKLTRKTEAVGYDEYDGMVIRAADESEARKIADVACGDEGRVWSSPEAVKCVALSEEGDSEIVLSSYVAG